MRKRILIISEDYFIKNKNGEITPKFSNLKDDIKKEEMNYDVIAYLERERSRLIILKSRPGGAQVSHVELTPTLVNLISWPFGLLQMIEKNS